MCIVGFLDLPLLIKVWKMATTGKILLYVANKFLPCVYTLMVFIIFVERDLAVIAICHIEVLSPLFHLLQRINKLYV